MSDPVSAPLPGPESAPGSPPGSAAVSPGASEAYAAICTALTETFGFLESELRPGATFEELDVDSLALLEFALVMGAHLGVHSADTDLRPGMTLGEAAEYVATLRSGSEAAGTAARPERTPTG
ncbi:acyl carrier protein [Streptomyces lydicus]|uniref:acyl carrier protein n=1 Tax=Streptomyces lydicus TaxID=47763 RepID=UPI00378729A8